MSSPNPPVPNSARRRDALVAGALAASVLLFALGPALPTLGTRLLGAEIVDGQGTAWFYWAVDDALKRGAALTHTDRMFWPWGKDLHLHTGTNILDALAAVPFRRLLGDVLGTNIFWILGILATWGMSRTLLRNFTDQPLFREPLAAILAVGPPVLLDMGEGRPTQAILFLPVLFFWALWRTGTRPGLGWPILTGLALAASGYQYWFYAIFAGAAALGHGLVATVQAGRDRGKGVLLRHALAAAVATLAVAPAALSLVAGAQTGKVPGLLFTRNWGMASQATYTLEGATVSMLTWQPLLSNTGWSTMHPQGGQVFLRYVALDHPLLLLLVILGVASAGAARARLVGILLPLVLFAVGPTLVFGDIALPNYPFIWLLDAFPFMRRLWWPARALPIAAIPAAIAVVYALHRLRAWRPLAGRAVAFSLAPLWALLTWSETLAPIPTWDPTPPAGYRCLAEGPEGAILELPWGVSQTGLPWQAAHGRPLVGGMAEGNPSLVPTKTGDLFRADPLFQKAVLLTAEGTAPRGPIRSTNSSENGQKLQDIGVVYIVIKRDDLSVDPERDEELRQLLGKPVYQDARTLIYAPFGAPYPCPHLSLEPDEDRYVAPPTPRPMGKADGPEAVRLRNMYAPW